MIKKSVFSHIFNRSLARAGGGLVFCIAINLLFSCNNFLDGSEFKEQLEKDIAYANAPSYEIRVECDEGTGTITTGTILSKKVTDTFTVEFKIAAGVQFSSWKAYTRSSDGNLTELSSDYIHFNDSAESNSSGVYKANVSFLKAADKIIIKPLCLFLPKITAITPAMESSGCDQDTAIKISFNKKMDAESFGTFACISITSDEGTNLLDYFDTPYFSSDYKNLYISPLGGIDKEKLLIQPTSGTSTKNITVEVNFTGDQKDSDGIALTERASHKYKVNKNYGNLKEKTLVIQSNEAYGSFTNAGDKNCYVGYSIEVQFTVNTDEYSFEGLEAVSIADNSISRSDCVAFILLEKNEETGLYKYSVRLTEDAADILIRPVCIRLPNFDFDLTGSNGKFSPAKGNYTCIQSHTYALSFDADSEWEFIRWKIYDSKTGEEIPNGKYLALEDSESPSTSYSLAAVPEESVSIALKPVISERPQILSYSPTYNPSGSWSDTTIQIVFDYDMDSSSIYYTKEEIQELHKDGTAYTAFLPPVSESELAEGGALSNHYGYTKDSQVFFKNITIEDKRTGENLTKYYGEPLFDDPTTLFIPVNDGAAANLKKGMNIKVTVDTGFCYKAGTKKVCMSRSEKWLYLVNGETDNEKPGISIAGFSIEGTNVTGSGKSSDGEVLAAIESSGSNIHSLFSGRFIKKNSLKLNIENLDVSDTGSNPNSKFTVVYKKIYNKDYTAISTPTELRQSFDYDSVVGPFANFTGSVELKNLEDGVYELYLDVRDRSNNLKCYPARDSESDAKAFYVSLDNTKPVINCQPLEVTGVSDNQTNFQLNFTSSDKDLHHTVVKIREYTGNQSEESWEGISGATFSRGVMPTLSASVRGKRYEVHAQFFDAAGNSTSKVLSRYSMPNKVSGINLVLETIPSDSNGNYTGKAALSWTKPAGSIDSYNIEVYTRDFNYDNYGDSYTLQKSHAVESGKNSCVLEELPYIYNFSNIPFYRFRIVSVLDGYEYDYCYEDKTEMAPPPAASAPSLSYSSSNHDYDTLFVKPSKPIVSYTGSTLGDFWNRNQNYYTVYMYLGETEADVKKAANTNSFKFNWGSTNLSSGPKLESSSFKIPQTAPWFTSKTGNNFNDITYFGYNGSSIYYAVKTVYNKGSGYESTSWSDVMKFPPERPVSYSINTERVLSHGEYVYVCVIKLTDSFNNPDQIKWRKKGSSTWISGSKNRNGYISSSFEEAAMFEPGETYDFIFEFTKSMDIGAYQAVTSRTEMEIKIETTQ